VKIAILCTAAASWYLLGLGVTVGAVVYPSFELIPEATWFGFHTHHSRRISYAVGGVWFAQAVGLIFWWISQLDTAEWFYCAGAALASVIVTAVWAVVIHRELATGARRHLLERLRVVHVVRTVCWAISGIAALVALR
jgi:hypothetical protein